MGKITLMAINSATVMIGIDWKSVAFSINTDHNRRPVCHCFQHFQQDGHPKTVVAQQVFSYLKLSVSYKQKTWVPILVDRSSDRFPTSATKLRIQAWRKPSTPDEQSSHSMGAGVWRSIEWSISNIRQNWRQNQYWVLQDCLLCINNFSIILAIVVDQSPPSP